MTAEALTDERLAELVAYCESINPVTHPQIVEQLSALRELRAYRTKRETHVWVPRDSIERSARDANELVCALFNRIRSEKAFDKFSGIADALHDRLRAMLAASDGNPP